MRERRVRNIGMKECQQGRRGGESTYSESLRARVYCVNKVSKCSCRVWVFAACRGTVVSRRRSHVATLVPRCYFRSCLRQDLR